jgi:hypothetical protein
MPNVVTSLSRKRRTTAEPTGPAPRHRRDGYFDEQDHWHDSSQTAEPRTHSAKG